VRLFTRNLIKLFQPPLPINIKKAAPLSIRIGCGTLTYVTAFFRTWPLPILISLPAGCSFLPSGAFLSVFCVYVCSCVCSGRGVRGTNVYYCIYIHTHIYQFVLRIKESRVDLGGDFIYTDQLFFISESTWYYNIFHFVINSSRKIRTRNSISTMKMLIS
jgi:hypothetical protein